jgi:RimJ/RimL family protein N-acetyltransferase
MATDTNAPEAKAATVPLEQHLQTLRLQGRLAEAQTLIRQAATQVPAFAPRARQLLLAHQPHWWAMPAGRRCRLRRRGPQDLAFIRQLWADDAFLRSFNPAASALPRDDAALTQILANEFSALVSTSHAIHWTIETLAGEPFGMLSLTDVNFLHRRAEILIGVHHPPYRGAAPEATLLAIDFAFGPMKLAKLVGLVPAHNQASLAASAHIGFAAEGLLRQHIVDPRDGKPIDIVPMGLLASDAQARAAQARLRKRLLPAPDAVT